MHRPFAITNGFFVYVVDVLQTNKLIAKIAASYKPAYQHSLVR